MVLLLAALHFVVKLENNELMEQTAEQLESIPGLAKVNAAYEQLTNPEKANASHGGYGGYGGYDPFRGQQQSQPSDAQR